MNSRNKLLSACFAAIFIAPVATTALAQVGVGVGVGMGGPGGVDAGVGVGIGGPGGVSAGVGASAGGPGGVDAGAGLGILIAMLFKCLTPLFKMPYGFLVAAGVLAWSQLSPNTAAEPDTQNKQMVLQHIVKLRFYSPGACWPFCPVKPTHERKVCFCFSEMVSLIAIWFWRVTSTLRAGACNVIILYRLLKILRGR